MGASAIGVEMAKSLAVTEGRVPIIVHLMIPDRLDNGLVNIETQVYCSLVPHFSIYDIRGITG